MEAYYFQITESQRMKTSRKAEEKHLTDREANIRITTDFSETMNARGCEVFKMLRENNPIDWDGGIS